MHFFRIENKHVWDGENQRNHKARQVKCVSRNIINFPFCRQQPRKAARQETKTIRMPSSMMSVMMITLHSLSLSWIFNWPSPLSAPFAGFPSVYSSDICWPRCQWGELQDRCPTIMDS
ncbi:uncharacterized protein LOC27209054 isoform X3 [Drosophila simulans]|uniref:Uncharacterized protein, isoform A n=1 Tax=Drosophila simulans TaxID=7240 RepID=A0A0J9RYT4_DROSI|nr:uncharacterized protein LOC27209054 isoform X3 [Drosophila simulans]KMZ00360.1 uncharacterized protein Dsimw501_GD29211, isoform A [Drosophila simulans]